MKVDARLSSVLILLTQSVSQSAIDLSVQSRHYRATFPTRPLRPRAATKGIAIRTEKRKDFPSTNHFKT